MLPVTNNLSTWIIIVIIFRIKTCIIFYFEKNGHIQEITIVNHVTNFAATAKKENPIYNCAVSAKISHLLKHEDDTLRPSSKLYGSLAGYSKGQSGSRARLRLEVLIAHKR
jgi:hypothetical protein